MSTNTFDIALNDLEDSSSMSTTLQEIALDGRDSNAETPSAEHIEWYKHVDLLERNALIASYRAEPKATGSFTIFLNLPSELRIKIWHHAISVPRIVEFRQMRQPPSLSHHRYWRYMNTRPPALLSTNAEARKETLRAYKNYDRFEDITTSIGGPEWFRYDWDTLHLTDMAFSDGFARHGFTGDIRRWWRDHTSDWDESDGTDKWIGGPDIFERVEALAINREAFLNANDDGECIIRHFFPNLQLLIVLIDDGIGNIEKIWDLMSGDFGEYEHSQPRRLFVRSSTGPYTKCSEKNSGYVNFIYSDMEDRFDEEEATYEDYTSPVVKVMGCSLPPGLEDSSFTRDFGRVPTFYESEDEDSASESEIADHEQTDCESEETEVESGEGDGDRQSGRDQETSLHSAVRVMGLN